MPKRREGSTPLSHSELEQLCRTIYGRRGWQTKLAEELQINPRTVRRWAAGAVPVPHAVGLTVKMMAFLNELSWLGEWRKYLEEEIY